MSAHTSETRRKLECRSTSRAHLAPSTSVPTAVTVLAMAAAAAAATACLLPGFPAFELFSALLFGVSVLQRRRFCCAYLQRCTKSWTCFAKQQPCRTGHKFLAT